MSTDPTEVLRRLYSSFPKLSGTNWVLTSEATDIYNCIAWAAGQNESHWWPYKDRKLRKRTRACWPINEYDNTVACFNKAFSTLGYAPTSDPSLKDGFEKLAIYVDSNDRVTHMARQLPTGSWTSKCGSLEDITHTLDGLEGKLYGTAKYYLVRQIK